MLTSDHPWDPASINDKLEVKVNFPKDNEVDDDHYDCLFQINTADMHLDQYYSFREVECIVTCIDNQDQIHILTLNTTEE